MNILFLTSRLPYPPNRGDKVRTFFFLKELAKQHNITLVSLIEDGSEERYKGELYKYCKNIYLFKHKKVLGYLNLIKAIFSRKPFQVQYYRNRHLKDSIAYLIEKENIQIVYTHLIRMAPYVCELPIKKILDYTDAISMEYRRSLPHRKNLIKKLFFRIESGRTEKYEKQVIEHFDEGWFISKEDIGHLRLEENGNIYQVPNPVEINRIKTDFSLSNKLIFVGNLSVQHNIDAVLYMKEHIMPELLKRTQEVEFEVTGADAVAEITALASEKNINVNGFVEDLYQELIDSDIFVAPMFFSAGIQNKVLEAMAVGLPVITTSNVARSINAEHQKNILIADDSAGYLDCIMQLLGSEELRAKIGSAGLELVRKSYSCDLIGKILQERVK